jgi:hypothetical protein
MFAAGRFVQALIGKGEESDISYLKSLKHGLLPIQAELPESCYV